jgi:RsiW-degrading membrane proteinase PrsW (M82 family)
MFNNIKQSWRNWREKWTVDHTVDVVVDLVLLLIDVIASPVLICVRLIRYVIGDWVTDKIKRGIKAYIHWWEKRSKPVRSFLLILFLIGLPFILIIVYFFTEIVNMYFEYNWND